MKKYKRQRIYTWTWIGLTTIVISLFFYHANKANAATLPEIQPVHPITAIEQYGYAEGLEEWEIATLIRIAKCESNFNNFASNPNSSAKGVYQFLSSSWAAWGEGSVYDTRENVRAAIKYYQHSGTTPWVCK